MSGLLPRPSFHHAVILGLDPTIQLSVCSTVGREHAAVLDPRVKPEDDGGV